MQFIFMPLLNAVNQIRVFGDPRTHGSDVPVMNINLVVELEPSRLIIKHDSSQDIICDFVDGFAFGDAIGVGLRSVSGWWTVSHVKLVDATIEVTSLRMLIIYKLT
jgi:hypothetical protein